MKNENSNRIVDYAEGSSKKLGMFLNKITYPDGRIKLAPGLVGLYIVIGLGIGGTNLTNYIIKYFKPNVVIVEGKYKNPRFSKISTLHGYDFDDNGSIDKIVETNLETNQITNKVFEYYPKNKEFSELIKFLDKKTKVKVSY